MSDSAPTAAPPRRRMMRDIAGVFSARAMWAVLGMISGVILARQLGPHDRGILALILLVPSTVITISKLGIAQSIVYAINREKQPVAAVASNVISLAFILSAISIALVWALRDTLLEPVLHDIPTWALAFALARVPMLLLAHSFLPALITPAHCSCFASSAETDIATDAVPTASRLVIAACNRFEFLIAVTPVVAVKARDHRGLIASADARKIAMAVPAARAA